MARSKSYQYKEWHQSVRDDNEALGRIVTSSLQSLLQHASIPYLSVSYRVKTEASFLAKIREKRYKDPKSDCTDLLGIRLITYLEDDVNRAATILKNSFSVDSSKSVDKRTPIEVDRVGYRSLHFVATLGAQRSALPEYSRFEKNVFEIQIRTVLQHAWAEIEHTRNYKFSSSLPRELERRLYVVAGVLELADREFNGLAQDITAYSNSVAAKAKTGDLNIELNSPSLRVFMDSLRSKFKKLKLEQPENTAQDDDLVKELLDYGINTLSDLERLFTAEFFAAYDRDHSQSNDYGILRDAMMHADISRYFERAWKDRWGSMEPEAFAPLLTKYGSLAREILTNNEVHTMNLDDDWS